MNKRKTARFLCSLIISLALLFHTWLVAAADGLQVQFLGVGSADCAILMCDGEAMIIDTGYAKSWEHIKDVLMRQDIRDIKYLVLTHPHADHIGCTSRIAANFDIQAAILPPIEHETAAYDKMIAALHDEGAELLYPNVGDTYSLGGAEIIVYGPHPVAYGNLNDWSVVIMVKYGGRSILLTGDIEAEAEGDLLAYDGVLPLKADFLKVAHHGSDSSSTFDFIKAVSPLYAFVSCDSTEKREYPHVETAMTLVDCGVIDIYTTEKAGDITLTIKSDGEYSIVMENK